MCCEIFLSSFSLLHVSLYMEVILCSEFEKKSVFFLILFGLSLVRFLYIRATRDCNNNLFDLWFEVKYFFIKIL